MSALVAQAEALFKQGRLDEAAALCRKVLASKPKDGMALHLTGVIQWRQGRPKDAVDTLRKAAATSPSHAGIQTLLGVIYQEQKDLERALRHFERAYELAPVPAHAGNLGYSLVLAEREPDRAEQLLRQAATVPELGPQPHRNLAHLLMRSARLEEAEREARTALQLDPTFPEACITLLQILRRRGRVLDALPAFEEALRRAPQDPEAHWNKAIAHLLLGQYEEGWREAEWRFAATGFTPSVYPFPRWDGTAAPDATLLVHHEQGFGDTIQFVRFLPRLRGRVGRVVLACQEPLLRLLQDVEGADQVVAARTDRPIEAEADLQVALLSLPGLLGVTLDDLDVRAPYLKPTPEDVARWQNRIAGNTIFRVGLAWAGSGIHRNDRARSMSLTDLAPLWDVPGVAFYSLQKDGNTAGTPLVDHTADLHDFADTAALMSHLDLVISVDTAVAHLAGATARPVWTLHAFDSDWRWLLDREDSPWYPTMRLFRQPQPGDWPSVVSAVRDQLTALVSVSTR